MSTDWTKRTWKTVLPESHRVQFLCSGAWGSALVKSPQHHLPDLAEDFEGSRIEGRYGNRLSSTVQSSEKKYKTRVKIKTFVNWSNESIRLFSSSKHSHFQNETKCKNLWCYFHTNVFALSLTLKQRLEATWKWPFRTVENLGLPLQEKLEASTIKTHLSMVNKDLEEGV